MGIQVTNTSENGHDRHYKVRNDKHEERIKTGDHETCYENRSTLMTEIYSLAEQNITGRVEKSTIQYKFEAAYKNIHTYRDATTKWSNYLKTDKK